MRGCVRACVRVRAGVVFWKVDVFWYRNKNEEESIGVVVMGCKVVVVMMSV